MVVNLTMIKNLLLNKYEIELIFTNSLNLTRRIQLGQIPRNLFHAKI